MTTQIKQQRHYISVVKINLMSKTLRGFFLRQFKVCMIIKCLLSNNRECMSILNPKYFCFQARLSPGFAKNMMNGP